MQTHSPEIDEPKELKTSAGCFRSLRVRHHTCDPFGVGIAVDLLRDIRPIRDCVGAEVKNEKYEGGTAAFSVEISHLSPGIYLVTWWLPNGAMEAKKIIKE